MDRSPLTDARWSLIRRFLLTDRRHGGRPPHDHRRRLDAILHVLRAGCPWRDLPPAFGSWRSAYSCFRRWTARGVWQRVLDKLAGERDCAAYMIDSTIIKVHQHACGTKKGLMTKPSAARAAV